MNWALSSILIGMVACWPYEIDDNCICKIEANEKMHYCGYELRDPNCYPHATYKCLNGDNGKARFGTFCHSTICNFVDDAAGCMPYNAFEKGTKACILK
jgi:hypothetical protein